jgi:predicted dehydrogenase
MIDQTQGSPKLKIAIVGLGKMGQIRKSVLEILDAVQIVALCDPSLDGRDITGEGILQTQDYTDVLEASPDAVFVCTPNNVTAEVTVWALEHGMHVFCEKPPGRDLTDTSHIAKAASARPDLKVKFGFNHRYHSSVRQAYNLITSGRLGQILWMRGIYGKSGGKDFEAAWRSRRAIAGGGILLDQGIHMLDLFRLFGGEFEDVRSMVATRFWPIDMEDNAFALLRNQEGMIAFLHSSSTHWKHTFSLSICLSEGHITLDGILSGTGSYAPETLRISRRQFEDESQAVGQPRQEVIYFDTDPSWELEVGEFVSSVLEDRPIQVGTVEDARRTMELVYRIYSGDVQWPHSTAAGEELGRAFRGMGESEETR